MIQQWFQDRFLDTVGVLLPLYLAWIYEEE
jgi:hypothetical protein